MSFHRIKCKCCLSCSCPGWPSVSVRFAGVEFCPCIPIDRFFGSYLKITDSAVNQIHTLMPMAMGAGDCWWRAQVPGGVTVRSTSDPDCNALGGDPVHKDLFVDLRLRFHAEDGSPFGSVAFVRREFLLQAHFRYVPHAASTLFRFHALLDCYGPDASAYPTEVQNQSLFCGPFQWGHNGSATLEYPA